MNYPVYRRPSVVLAPLFLLASIAEPAVDAADLPPKFVVAEYLNGLTALSNRFANCGGEGSFSSVSTSRGGVIIRTHISFALTPTRGRLIETAADSADDTPSAGSAGKKAANRTAKRVFVYNSDYSFALSSPSPNGSLSIDSLETGPDRGKRTLAIPMKNPSNFATHIYGRPLATMISKPEFRVEAVKEVEPALGSRRIRVDFTIPRSSPGKPSSLHDDAGWLVISPDLGWLLHEYGLVTSLNIKPSAQYTHVGYVLYARSDDGAVRPTKYGDRVYSGRLEADPAGSGVVPSTTEEFEFTSFRLGETPEREFTLTAFGLPEFGEPAAKRLNRPFPWWIVGAAVGAGGLAVALRRLAKRPQLPKIEPVA